MVAAGVRVIVVLFCRAPIYTLRIHHIRAKALPTDSVSTI